MTHPGAVIEYSNRNRLSERLLLLGWDVFVPLIDTGIDILARKEATRATRAIQLKSRWTVDRKYVGRDLWIAFPDEDDWYLVPHDKLFDLAPEGVATSRSWLESGLYSRKTLSASLREALRDYRLPDAP